MKLISIICLIVSGTFLCFRNASGPTILVYHMNNDIENYSGQLFSDSALVLSQKILDTISERSDIDFRLVFGITFLKPFLIEENLLQDSVVNFIENYNPQELINDSINNVTELYNNELLERFTNDNSSFNSSTQVLIMHNIFIYPLPDNRTMCTNYIGYHTTSSDFTSNVFTGFEFCGELDPTANISSNDIYLINFVNELFTGGRFYDNHHINDQTSKLLYSQRDSIGLMIDTIQSEREWNVVVDVLSSQCTNEIDTVSVSDTIQIVVEVDDSGQSTDYELNVYVSPNLTTSLPERYLTFIIDSIASPLLDTNNLYQALINSIERFRRPLPGDVFFNMGIVHNNSAPNSGGMFGCARVGSGCSTSSIANLPTYSNKNKVHNGLDIYSPLETDIFAMYDGIVQRVISSVTANTEGTQGAFGNRVRLRHTAAQYGGASNDPIIYTYYTHLNAVENLTTQDVVTQGQLLGQTGRTGNAVGIPAWRYHSHILVYEGGITTSHPVDPRPYLFTQFNINGTPTN